MRFHADLHIHSKYSRATSRDLDLEHLAYWACRKGIAVVATGDFTHPAWRAELKEKLVPAEPGLFRLREPIERAVAQLLPPACQTTVRFMLEVEISTIYKKGDRTRKIHHLLYAPDFETADRISDALGRIGNISSDGRPILGLDSRHLLEITLQGGPDAYLIPAHIWTPWFAVLGSQSGFDSIVDCYGDLSDHIFAVETGLSSDPAMNWRLSMLDRYRLVSNSDAHSPGKLGREATTFDTEIDYFAIRTALETGRGYVGTVEFFPEEGKYYHDGHRKCGVRLTPSETATIGTRCPTCGAPMTIGVLSRTDSLADRPEGCAPPATAGHVASLVPLPEVLSELAGSGPGTKTVERHYDRLVSTLGAELSILNDVPVEDIARAESSLLAEAITRLRAGSVIREAGYDGEYGVIKLFEEGELRRLAAGGKMLFEAPVAAKPKAGAAKAAVGRATAERATIPHTPLPPSPPSVNHEEGGKGGSEPPPHANGRDVQGPITEADGANARDGRIIAGGGGAAPWDGSPRPASAVGGPDSTDRAPHAAIAGADDRSPRAANASASTDAPALGGRGADAGDHRPTAVGGEGARSNVGLLDGLDADQRRAAETVEGPLLIVAGPGSGKTRTVTHRIAHLIAARGVPAAACLAITFTRRAAAEMRDRLAVLVPGQGDDAEAGGRAIDCERPAGAAGAVNVHTFHSLGLAILREQAAAAGLERGFRIANETQRLTILTDTLSVSERKATSLLRAISKAKRTQRVADGDALVQRAAGGGAPTAHADARPVADEPGDLGSKPAADRAPAVDPDIADAFAAYQQALTARGCLDFDDLVGLTVRLLTTRPDVAAQYRERFRWISVDEFQDVDEQQYRLLTLLAPADGNLCVIGDPNQAIYGFRGADSSCFDRFAQDYPTATTVTLARNYRSSGTIVTASSQVITSSQTPTQTQGQRQGLAQIVRAMHERIAIQTTPTERAEAEFVIQTIEGLLGGHSFFSIDSGRAPNAAAPSSVGFADFAVLFRTDAQSAALVEAFSRSGIPFKKHAHEPLTGQPIVQALLRHLDALDQMDVPGAGPHADVAPDAGAGAALPPLTTQLRCAAGQIADDPQPALGRLLTLAEAAGNDRHRFADAVALATEADFWDPRGDRVSLLTLHAAKGLEFPIVFIIGLEDGILPLYWDRLDEATMAEERRLFYVGMTRAKDRLVLSRATQRMWRGKLRALEASPFLNDIEQELVKHQRTTPAPARKKPEDAQLKLL